MMSVFLAFVALTVNLILVLKRPRSGILLFVILAMVLPHPSIAGTAVAYEIFALLPVLLAALIKRPRVAHIRLHLFLAVFLGLIVLSTIVSTTAHGTGFDAIRFQGIVRFFVLLAVCRELLDRDAIETALLITIGVNVLVGSAQLVFPGTASVFLDLYGRPGQVVLERYALADVIRRPSGTFSSPVTLGAVALLALAVAWSRLLARGAAPRHRWLLILAGVAGIMSLTKTFVLGAPLVFLGGLALSPFSAHIGSWRFRPRTMAAVLGTVTLTAGVAYWIGDFMDRSGLNVAYYFAYLANPEAALATRYGEGGQLGATMAIIRENPVIGVGMTKLKGEFLGDSTYILLLHTSGILGVALASTALLLIVHRIVAQKRHLDLLVVGALLVAGAALPFIFSLPGALGIVYVLGHSTSSTSWSRKGYLARPVRGNQGFSRG